MVQHSCPHCKADHHAHGRRKHHQCKNCGGFFQSAYNAIKKIASNPMVQGLVKAAAPHAMNLLNKHAPGLAKVANKAVGLYQKHAPMINKVLSSNPQQLLQQARANPGQFAQSAARALAPHAQNLAQRHAPGLTSSVQRAVSSPLGQMGQQGLAAFLGKGTHKGQKRKTARLAYEPKSESESDEEEKMGKGRHRKAHTKHRRGGFGFQQGLQAAQMAAPLIGMIPGANDALGPVLGMLGGPQQAPPPPPPRASFRAIEGFEAPGMVPRSSVMGRGRRTRAPTAHSLAVKEVMKQTGMGLPAASKYVKEHGLAK